MTLFGIVVPGNVYPVLTIGARSKDEAEKLWRKHCRGNLPTEWLCLPTEEAKHKAVELWETYVFGRPNV